MSKMKLPKTQLVKTTNTRSKQQEEEAYLSKKINRYEQEQKQKLVELGQSAKPYRDILAFLKNEIEMSTKMTNFRYELLCFRDDGVYQLNKAIEKLYGVSKADSPEGPSGKQNIETIDVRLANGVRVKVPYGQIDMPDMGEGAGININYNNSNNILYIQGSCEFKYASFIDDIIDETKRGLSTESIYKDQAIEIGENCIPKVLDISNIENEFMILSEKTEYELRPLMSRIKFPERCIERGIPLKTGVLLEGGYGTGKTLAAFKIAYQAINNGWCFIYLKKPELLAQVLRLSQTIDKNGNGVIVFLEDVDQVTRGNRDASMQDILNTLDGGDTKNMNVISIFTTNHIELIEPTFLRGKRIGSIISMGSLDAKTAMLFLEYSFQGEYELEREGLEDVCQRIEKENIVPAFMAEIVESVKSNMIFEDNNIVKAEYINISLDSYLRQVSLSKVKDMSETPAEKLSSSLKEVISDKKMMSEVEEIHDWTQNQ